MLEQKRVSDHLDFQYIITQLVNFLKILYNFEALKFHLLFKLYCFFMTNLPSTLSYNFWMDDPVKNIFSVFSGHRNSLNIYKRNSFKKSPARIKDMV